MTAPVLSATERAAREAVIAHLRSAGYVGKGFDGLTRAAFDELAELAFLRAEDACRGELVNPLGRRQDIDPRSLFRGPRARAERWASEELLRHWEDVGRLSYDEYAEDLIKSGLDEIGANETDDDDEDEDEEQTAVTTTVTDVEHDVDPLDDLDAEVIGGPARRHLTRGAQALDEARAFYRRYYHFPTTAALDAYTVWVGGLTHMRDQHGRYLGPTAIRMLLRASTSNAGKSLLGDMIAMTGGNAEVVFAPASTYWGVVQMIAEENKVPVLDNWDEVVGVARQGQLNIMLAGAYEGTALLRSGKAADPYAYVLAPLAITAIGDKLRRRGDFKPVEERSLVIDVDKKPEHVKLARFDRRDEEIKARARGIQAACKAWGEEIAPEAMRYRPADLPDLIPDGRMLEMWETLVAIADFAGGEWPERIRRALRVLALGEAVVDDEADPFVRLTPAERSMVEASFVLRRALDAAQTAALAAGEHAPSTISMTTAELFERMAALPGGERWTVPTAPDNERKRVFKARSMALADDLRMFGVERSSVKVPVGDGSGRFVQGWFSKDVLPRRPSDLPTFRPSDLYAQAQQLEEDEVPFE